LRGGGLLGAGFSGSVGFTGPVGAWSYRPSIASYKFGTIPVPFFSFLFFSLQEETIPISILNVIQILLSPLSNSPKNISFKQY
jgi:hypothetical protein